MIGWADRRDAPCRRRIAPARSQNADCSNRDRRAARKAAAYPDRRWWDWGFCFRLAKISHSFWRDLLRAAIAKPSLVLQTIRKAGRLGTAFARNEFLPCLSRGRIFNATTQIF